jgi:hypothetical protein
MYVALLIVHGLMAVALLGAITHQAVSAWMPAVKPAGSFTGRFRAVAGGAYTNAIVVLYLCTAVLGGFIYPEFRVSIRGVIEELDLRPVMGVFELKEHFVIVGAAVLPAYWYLWRQRVNEDHPVARKALTTILAFVTWWSFLVGHVVNNFRGYSL